MIAVTPVPDRAPIVCLMAEPKLCPVCGHDHIRPVERTPLFRFEGEQDALSGVLAYRCDKGHMFLVIRESPPKQKPNK